MYENEEERQPHGCADGIGVSNAPRYAGKEHEEGEKVGEGRVGSMPCVFCFCQSFVRERRMGSKVVGASIRFWAVVLVGEDSVGEL